MRHFYSFILLAVLSCIAGTNAWAYDFEADGIFYNITSSTKLTVAVTYGTTDNNSYSGDVVIPATVENEGTTYSVTSIGSYAFYQCTGLTSIEIPSSVTRIGDNAFYQIRGLTSVEIPSGVTSIGNSAFYNTSVEMIILPQGLTHIGASAFAYCYNLKDINLPESLTDISTNAFTEDFSLPSENGLIYVGNFLVSVVDFSQTTYEIKDGTTIIGHQAFRNCINLKNISIPASTKQIDSYAFHGCTALTEVFFQDGAACVGGFQGCTALTSVKIPNSVKVINDAAFSGCI